MAFLPRREMLLILREGWFFCLWWLVVVVVGGGTAEVAVGVVVEVRGLFARGELRADSPEVVGQHAYFHR